MLRKKGINWVCSPDKRVVDLGLVGVMAPVAVPSVILGGAAVALADRVNPVFTQVRIGQNLEPFLMSKVKTMPTEKQDTPSHGYDDPRASRVGKILRQLHIDELPQSLMIVKGLMSVVGPRPILGTELDYTLDELSLSEQKEWLRARSILKPGLAFLYNIQQHTEEGKLSYRSRAEEDVNYLNTASFVEDMRIIFQCATYTKADFLGLNVSPSQN